jgi:lipoic acid synthetase
VTALSRESLFRPAPEPIPPWIRVRPPRGPLYPEVRDLLAEHGLGTVCREARCPNLPECWSRGTATLMLLGTDCTRRCAFCAVRTHWSGGAVDASEPDRVARAVARWGLRYVVLTQVCRDDLADGGAEILAETVRRLRASAPDTLVELLVGDLGGSADAVRTVLENPPDVFAHNLETVRRLSGEARDRRAGYDRSLEVLSRARQLGAPNLVTKSSLMLGLGEKESEVSEAFGDLRSVGVDLLTLGQYLRPSLSHLPVDRYVPPEEFERLRERALGTGFAGVEAGPLVRSSYRAEELFRRAHTARSG